MTPNNSTDIPELELGGEIVDFEGELRPGAKIKLTKLIQERESLAYQKGMEANPNSIGNQIIQLGLVEETITQKAREDTVKELYQIAKDEINQSSAENVPIYVREMQAIQIYAQQHGINLSK